MILLRKKCRGYIIFMQDDTGKTVVKINVAEIQSNEKSGKYSSQ
jgi:hypothetical protein